MRFGVAFRVRQAGNKSTFCTAFGSLAQLNCAARSVTMAAGIKPDYYRVKMKGTSYEP